MHWILILTIITTNQGATIESVPGFMTLEVCLSAGRKWGETVSANAVAGERYAAVCVHDMNARLNVLPPKKKPNR